MQCAALRKRKRLTCRRPRRNSSHRTSWPSRSASSSSLRRRPDHSARIVLPHLHHSRTGHRRLCRRLGHLGALRGLRPGDWLRHVDSRAIAGYLFRHRRGEHTVGRFDCRRAGAGDALFDHRLPAGGCRYDRGGGIRSAAVGGGGDRLGRPCRGTRHRDRLGSDYSSEDSPQGDLPPEADTAPIDKVGIMRATLVVNVAVILSYLVHDWISSLDRSSCRSSCRA